MRLGSKGRAPRARKRKRASVVHERRVARRVARAQCRVELSRLRVAIPAERDRVAGLIAQIRASARQGAAQLIAQAREGIRAEREALRARIAQWRRDARLGRCVDRAVGPALPTSSRPSPSASSGRSGRKPARSSLARKKVPKTPEKAHGLRVVGRRYTRSGEGTPVEIGNAVKLQTSAVNARKQAISSGFEMKIVGFPKPRKGEVGKGEIVIALVDDRGRRFRVGSESVTYAGERVVW